MNAAEKEAQAAGLSGLVTKEGLCTRLAMSPRCLEGLVKRGEFPEPVRIGKRVYWSEKAIQRWQKRMFGAQEAWAPT